MHLSADGRAAASNRSVTILSAVIGGTLLLALIMIAMGGFADPVEGAEAGQSLVTVMVNASVIVFREGLEAILILAAVTASFLGARQGYRRPVAIGAGAAFGFTVFTWFAAQWVLSFFRAYEDVLLAVTGALAIVVLLIVMNWFFHKLYWTQWIGKHNANKRRLVQQAEADGGGKGALDKRAWWGFVALGFTAVYREGFEVVLFLQNLQVQAGTAVVLQGVAIGLLGTVAVGVLTFLLHHKLPYKKMLVLTGIMLGFVLVVMTGGTARTFQDLGWISNTSIGFGLPDWMARWFEVVPTVETIGMQIVAGLFVVGSYYLAEHLKNRKVSEAGRAAGAAAGAASAAAMTNDYTVVPAADAVGACGVTAPDMQPADSMRRTVADVQQQGGTIVPATTSSLLGFSAPLCDTLEERDRPTERQAERDAAADEFLPKPGEVRGTPLTDAKSQIDPRVALELPRFTLRR